jgi:hypothetical protein
MTAAREVREHRAEARSAAGLAQVGGVMRGGAGCAGSSGVVAAGVSFAGVEG